MVKKEKKLRGVVIDFRNKKTPPKTPTFPSSVGKGTAVEMVDSNKYLGTVKFWPMTSTHPKSAKKGLQSLLFLHRWILSMLTGPWWFWTFCVISIYEPFSAEQKSSFLNCKRSQQDNRHAAALYKSHLWRTSCAEGSVNLVLPWPPTLGGIHPPFHLEVDTHKQIPPFFCSMCNQRYWVYFLFDNDFIHL